MANILVTGGAGFVGRHLTKRLTSAGHTVTIVDNMSSESSLHPDEWPSIVRVTDPFLLHFVNDDVRNWFATSNKHFDFVVHAAAMVGGRLAIEGKPLLIAEDLAIDAAMFNWAIKAMPDKVAYLSSSAAYPTWLQDKGCNRQLRETDINLAATTVGIPDMTYGWSKLTGELLARMACKKHGLKVACFRPFSGYGQDQHPAYPFPAIIRRVIDNEDKPITVWGSGEQERDFIHIDDCADAIVRLSSGIDDASAVNLGTGRPMSFKKLASMIHMIAFGHPPAQIITDETKPAGVYSRVADIVLMNAMGFYPRTTLEEGIATAITFVHMQRAMNADFKGQQQ